VQPDEGFVSIHFADGVGADIRLEEIISQREIGPRPSGVVRSVSRNESATYLEQLRK
jgi:hypothetical protein